MAIVFLESAAKHGFIKDDAVHAVNHSTFYLPEFEHSRTGGASPHLVIGPSMEGIEIEVMFTVEDHGIVIFHCMEARKKMKALHLREEKDE